MQYYWLNKARSNMVATCHSIKPICKTIKPLCKPIKSICCSIQDTEIGRSAFKTKSLIIFFGGWSFDYLPFEYLKCGDNDVLMVYDYNEILPNIFYELQNEFIKYDNITLIAWSMGVYVAEILKDNLPHKINKKIAINGTMYPIHDEYGIPVKKFDLTLKHAKVGLKEKFYKNIFNDVDEFERYSLSPVERDLKNRISELENLNNFINKTEYVDNKDFYDFAIISKFDKIIPHKNQFNFWKSIGSDVIEVDAGHFPFYRFNSWDELINVKQTSKS